MKKKRRRELFRATAAYLDELRHRMLLGHWTITLSAVPEADPDAAASVTCMDTRHVATVYLGVGFHDCSPERRRHYLVHELLHCHLAQLDYAVGDFERATDDLSWQHLFNAYRRQTELAVDDLAVIIAPFMPLPPGDPS